MAVTYPLSLPSVTEFSSVVFRMRDIVAMSESPFSLSQQTYEHPGKRWEAHIEMALMTRARAEEWIGGFFAALNGVKGTFLMGDPAGATARGALGGTPLVNGAGQTGQVLNIDGCSNNITNWLRKGDYVQLGAGSTARLHKSMSDASSNGSGQVVLDLWPGFPIGGAPADNAALVVASTVGLWRLPSNLREFSIDVALHYGLHFDAVGVS